MNQQIWAGPWNSALERFSDRISSDNPASACIVHLAPRTQVSARASAPAVAQTRHHLRIFAGRCGIGRLAEIGTWRQQSATLGLDGRNGATGIGGPGRVMSAESPPPWDLAHIRGSAVKK